MSVAFVCLCATAALRAQAGVPDFEFAVAWKRVATEFEAGCEQAGVVGASLAFVRGGEVSAFVHHGLADRSTGQPVDDSTIFHWASCTKSLTGIATMQLRDRGKLQLEQSVLSLVPELREVHDAAGALPAITIRHLMQHTAGFRMATWPWGGTEAWQPHEPKHWSQLVAMMPYTNLEFAPGSRFSYSNFGIVLLGRAIEQLSGDDYEVYMEKNVLRPLGMRSSYFDATPYHQQRHRSNSYERGVDGSMRDLGADFDTGITVSNGGLNAPVTDMANYVSFLLGAREPGSDAAATLARTSLDEMCLPAVPTSADTRGEHMGLCFFVQEHAGQRVYTHTGGQHGFVSFFYVHPGSGTGAIAAFNTDSAGPVMQAIRRACIEQLSLPMTKQAADAPDGVLWKNVSLRLEREVGGANQLVVTVPSGGHELHYERATMDGDVVDVEVRLVKPAMGEVTTQAVEDLRATLPPKDLGGAKRVRIRMAVWQRGVRYFAEPEHELAATLVLR